MFEKTIKEKTKNSDMTKIEKEDFVDAICEDIAIFISFNL